MDFQQRIVNNVASEPESVVRNAARALEGARAAGIPVIYVVHRGGPFAEYAPDVELHEGVTPAVGERIITKTKPGTVLDNSPGRKPAGDGLQQPDRHGRGHQQAACCPACGGPWMSITASSSSPMPARTQTRRCTGC